MSSADFHAHLCIAASAGSGKTFSLAHRVLRLLAMGVSPDRIGAYTFSRKAAGEIFDAIIAYLCKAASDPGEAVKTSLHMGQTRTREGFLADLRSLLGQLHRLRIGTLDSRIAQMLSAAALELRLPAEFAMIDGQSPEARFLHERVLDELLRPGCLPEEASRAFLDAFSQATHGLSEKSFDRKLLSFIGDHRSVYLLTPQADAWLHPGPLPLPDLPRALPEEPRRTLARSLLAELPPLNNARLEKGLAALIEKAADYTPGKAWNKNAPSGALAAQVHLNDEPVITYYKKEHEIPESLWRGLRLLLRHPAGLELERAFAQTRGLHGLLSVFETRLRQESLSTGQISFEDGSVLMGGFNALPPDALAFRLDGEIDHWLLDEFQDTSLLQWRALEPFLEEVLQDAEGRRGLFYVGDVKQAIYAWRGGNADLFGQVRARYPVIQEVHMESSQRSAPAVLALVNQLMDRLPDDGGLPPAAVARWNREYRPHLAAERTRDLPGFARVVQAETLEEDEEDPHELIADVLRQIDPSFETAILTRSNTAGAELADALRRRGFEVALEGQSPLRSDTAVEAVLAALRLAAHPADDFSRQLLRMSGLSVHPMDLLQQVHQQGFARTVQQLSGQLALLPDADYSRDRLAKLQRAAVSFDALGPGTIDRFLAFVDGHMLKEHDSQGVIRIMTIHQSKGLGFDAVLFPLGSSGFVKVDGNKLATSATGVEPPWVLDLPPKEVCQLTAGLEREYERLEAESAYENLCNLYVALTRAKQSLHVILPPAPQSAGSPRVMHNWIRGRLEAAPAPSSGPELPGGRVLAAWGTPALPPRKPPGPPAAPPPAFPLAAGRGILPRLEPSQADDSGTELGRFYSEIPEDGRELGSRVHALLEQVDWTDGLDPGLFLAGHGEAADSPAAQHVRNALAFPELRQPPGATGLWREQRFEIVLDGAWITGIFDRVVLFPDGACIQDYKTNKHVSDSTIDHYAPQMKLYRKVLAETLSLPPDRIRCQLLFTAAGRVVEV